MSAATESSASAGSKRPANGGARRRSLFRRLAGQAGPVAGLVVLIVAVLCSVFAPVLTQYDPLKLNILDRLSAPSRAHLLGTDDFGRDVYSLVLYGGRASLLVGGLVMILTSVIGVVFGVVAGFSRVLDNVLMRIMDGLMAFPAIVLAIALREIGRAHV